MIKLRLSGIMGERRISQRELAKKTGIRTNTISDYYNEKAQYLNVEYLDKICQALKVDICDLLEYIPPKQSIPEYDEDTLTHEEKAEAEANWQAYLRGEGEPWDKVKKGLAHE